MQAFRTVLEKLNRRLLGANSLRHPNRLTARGISHQRWSRIQTEHELNYWIHKYPNEVPKGRGPKEYYRDHYWTINRSMFQTLDGVFKDARVVDVGCGPYGSMHYPGACSVIGIDPLAHEYQNHYELDDGILVLNAPAEAIPLMNESADVVISVNALDHMCKPYQALEEMYRICRIGGHFVLAADVGGAPDHPCNIQEHDLDAFIKSKAMQVVEHDCGTHRVSGWPKAMQIPLFVFHGVKRK